MTGQTRNEEAPSPARTWTVRMYCEGGGYDTGTVKAANVEEADKAAEELTRQWIRDGYDDCYFRRDRVGDRDEGGAETPVIIRVDGRWELVEGGEDDATPDDLTPIAESSIEVEIELNHEALIRAVGGNPDCEHEWSDGDEWAERNSVIYPSHCRHCGLLLWRRRHRDSSQDDTVRYKQTSYWCAKCQSDKRPCECKDEDEAEETEDRDGINQ